MRTIRRLFSILLGLAAGAAAWKILNDYGSDGHIEGEFVELDQEPEDSGEPSPSSRA